MAVAMTVFFTALACLFGLFALKRWEVKRERTLLPGVRRTADAYALRAKALLKAGAAEAEKLPPHLLTLFRASVRTAAMALAHLAQWLARKAHALADLVSHKHRFERRETNSEFLKQVIEHPMKPVNGRVNGVHPPSPASEVPNPREELRSVPEPDSAPIPAPLSELEHVRKPHSGSANSDFGLQTSVSTSKYPDIPRSPTEVFATKSEFSARKRVSGHALVRKSRPSKPRKKKAPPSLEEEQHI